MPDGKSIQFKKLFWSALAVLAAATLTACGGGGGGSTAGVVAGGGGGGGPVVIPPPACILGGNPAITVSLTASRVSGVAPLAVFFDASATLSTTFPTRPFHDLGFRWNFGESAGPGIAAWGRGARPASSRNEAVGPLAAHVFETPGTYTVCVTITDGNVTVDGAVVITVDDPNTVFAGAATTCFSTSGNFAGCPAGAGTITTSDFKAALATATPGRRLLFRGGESWNAAGIPRLTANGPGLIGSFGGGAKPRILQTPGNQIMLALSGAGLPISDWRVLDLEFDGLGDTSVTAIQGGAGGGSQITLLRVQAQDVNTGIQFSGPEPSGHLNWSQVAISDSVLQRINDGSVPPLNFNGGNGMFLMVTQLALLGNLVDDATGAEHIVRIQFGSSAVVQSNDLGLPNTTKHVLTVRGPELVRFTTAPNFTQKVVITDNLLRGGISAQPVTIQPTSPSNDERLRDIIFDGNFIRGGPASQTAFLGSADEITVRNNIINITGATAYNCMTFNRKGIEPPHSEIRIFNNTCFSNDAGGSPLRVVFLDNTNTSVTIANNLGYGPNFAAPILLLDQGSVGVIGGSGTFGNSSNAQILGVSPNFVNAGGASGSDYAINAPSYAINGGVAVPVFTDFFRNNRPSGGGFDIGAAEQ